MSQNTKKPKLDMTKLKTVEVSEIPAKASKGVWRNWISILKGLEKTPTKGIQISEKEASLPAVRNQIAKAITSEKIEGIILNTRNIDKVQYLFISYKKPIKK